MGVAEFRPMTHPVFQIGFGGGPFGSQGEGGQNFPPLVAFLIRPLLASPLRGGKFIRTTSGRSAPSSRPFSHVERYSRRQFSTGISKGRWRTPLEVMFQRGSAGRSRLKGIGDTDVVDGLGPPIRHSCIVQIAPPHFGFEHVTPSGFSHGAQNGEGRMVL